MGNHGRILPASVLTQSRINRLFQLQTGFAQQRRIIFQHLHFEGRSIHSGTNIPLAGSRRLHLLHLYHIIRKQGDDGSS